jgi:nitric oxide reductase NorD protein
MSTSHEALSFDAIHRSMAIFVEGIYGVCLQIESLASLNSSQEEQDRKSATTVFARIRPRINILYLPEALNPLDTRMANLDVCKITLLRQIEYLKNGTLGFEAKISTLRTFGARSKLLQPKDLKASAFEKRFAACAHPLLLKFIFDRLEERRIDEIVRRQYPGAMRSLRHVLNCDRKTVWNSPDFHLTLQHLARSQPAKAALGYLQEFALNALERYAPELSQKQTPIVHFSTPRTHGLVKDIIELTLTVSQEQASLADSANSALAICNLLLQFMAPIGEPQASRVQPSETESEKVPPLASGSLATQNPAASDQDDDLDGEGLVGEDYAPESGAVLKERPSDSNKQGKKPGLDAKEKSLASFRSFLYQEWNYLTGRYHPAWCRVVEQALIGEDTEFIQAVRRRHPKLWRQIKYNFSALRPTSFKRVYRLAEGDELDLDRLVERQAERHIKRQQDDGLFVRRERTRRDVSVAFLVDMSASTSILIPPVESEPSLKDEKKEASLSLDNASESMNDYPYLYGGGMSAQDKDHSPAIIEPESKPRRVIDVAQDAVALMCEALHQLGDDFAVYGFSGDGREQVDFFVAKDFHDALSAKTWAAISAMQPKRSSRLGPAIRHSSHKILRHATGRRLLMVISDGYPQDREYGPAHEDVEYGVQDTAQALREAERQGIQTFFVTIDPAGYDYLGRMCPDNRYLLIEDVLELPYALGKIYQSMKADPIKTKRIKTKNQTAIEAENPKGRTATH